MAAAHPKLRVRGATKVYHTRSGDLLAIDRCSLDVMEGEIVSIVGIAAKTKQMGGPDGR